jgi:hypothetical protein
MSGFSSDYATKFLQASSENKSDFSRSKNMPEKNTQHIKINHPVKRRSLPDPITRPVGEHTYG